MTPPIDLPGLPGGLVNGMGWPGWGRVSSQEGDRKPMWGEVLRELAGLAWQAPKATGEGIWDWVEAVADTLFRDRGCGIG